MNEHPTYPIRHGVPAMDRCICGGVRHWHALAPNGCDDCDCEEFALDESWRAPVEPVPAPTREKDWIDELPMPRGSSGKSPGPVTGCTNPAHTHAADVTFHLTRMNECTFESAPVPAPRLDEKP